MKRLALAALLLALIGVTGCSFLLKEYDDRNERKLEEISKENKSLVSKVRNLERKVPEMNRQLQELEAENERLKMEVGTIDRRLSSAGAEDIEIIEMPEQTEPMAEPEPEVEEAEEPFTLSDTEDISSPKPVPQAPKSKLTPAAAKIMAMAKNKGASGETAGTETAAEEMSAPEPAPEPSPMPKAEEAAPKSQLTPEAAKIMALAQKKAGLAEEAAPEAVSEPTQAKIEEAAPKSQLTPDAAEIMARVQQKTGGEEPAPEAKAAPAPAPKPEPAAKPAAEPVKQPITGSSKLTPEARRILAMARGEKPSPESGDSKPAKTEMAGAPVKKAAMGSVRLKVLGGTGSIASAKRMSDKLGKMGYQAESVALAPRSNFDKNTIYFSKGYESTAREIKNKLGGNTITKPLSWNSEFDIIVVSAE